MYAHISLWEKSWNLCVIVVNRFSSLSWMIGQKSCLFWYLHRLVSIYLPTFIFMFLQIELTKCKFQNEKRDYKLQRSIAHTSICLGKRESDLLNWNIWYSKSQRLNHNVEISKISSTDLKKRCIIQKGSNVMNYAEAKWKVSKFCNHSLVGGHICSFI